MHGDDDIEMEDIEDDVEDHIGNDNAGHIEVDVENYIEDG